MESDMMLAVRDNLDSKKTERSRPLRQTSTRREKESADRHLRSRESGRKLMK